MWDRSSSACSYCQVFKVDVMNRDRAAFVFVQELGVDVNERLVEGLDVFIRGAGRDVNSGDS